VGGDDGESKNAKRTPPVKRRYRRTVTSPGEIAVAHHFQRYQGAGRPTCARLSNSMIDLSRGRADSDHRPCGRGLGLRGKSYRLGRIDVVDDKRQREPSGAGQLQIREHNDSIGVEGRRQVARQLDA